MTPVAGRGILPRSEYRRRWRAMNPDAVARARLATTARGRALTRLAGAHPDEYTTLVNEERAKLGLVPAGSSLGRHARIITDPEAS
jgi:hypothetical protein